MTSYVVELWHRLFRGLAFLSPFKCLAAVLRLSQRKKETASFIVESWVIGHSLLAAVALIISRATGRTW